MTTDRAVRRWRAVVGALRFPFDALVGGADSPVPVLIQPDPSDVLAVVACLAFVLVLARRARNIPQVTPTNHTHPAPEQSRMLSTRLEREGAA